MRQVAVEGARFSVLEKLSEAPTTQSGAVFAELVTTRDTLAATIIEFVRNASYINT